MDIFATMKCTCGDSLCGDRLYVVKLIRHTDKNLYWVEYDIFDGTSDLPFLGECKVDAPIPYEKFPI